VTAKSKKERATPEQKTKEAARFLKNTTKAKEKGTKKGKNGRHEKVADRGRLLPSAIIGMPVGAKNTSEDRGKGKKKEHIEKNRKHTNKPPPPKPKPPLNER